MITKKWQRYPAYKDSGVEWLGEVPEEWEVKRLKNVAFLNLATLNEDTEPDYLLIYVDIGNVTSDGSVLETQEFQFEQAPSRARRKVKDGDTIISTVRTYLRAISLIQDPPENLIVSTGFAVLSPSSEIESQFLFRLVQSFEFVEKVVAHSEGVGYPAINPSKLACLPIWLPPLSEQKAIAQFLDRETAKIDNLIAKKERLIELLKEKRTALISHAVTKGLNPDAPMKDSGVEWLGEVPEHWEVKRFRELYEIRKRIAGTLGYNILAITQQGIQVKDIESGEGQLSMDYSKYQLVHKGEFAMNHMDLLTGFVDISKYDGVTSPDYRVFTLEDKDNIPEYHLFYLQMGYLNRLFYPFGHGAAHLGRWRLPTKAFREFVAPCPPKEEQEEIANYVFRSLDRNKLIHSKVMRAIQLLKEYRTALISAAVTGKIDVREH